jgi:hypothetical protein
MTDSRPHPERDAAESAVIQRIRDEIWHMDQLEQVDAVLRAIRDGLRRLGIDFFGISINDVDEIRAEVCYYTSAGEDVSWNIFSDRVTNAPVLNFMRSEHPTYRPDLHAHDPWGERTQVEATYGAPIRSILDVPFGTGTFVINSRSPEAFSGRTRA